MSQLLIFTILLLIIKLLNCENITFSRSQREVYFPVSLLFSALNSIIILKIIYFNVFKFLKIKLISKYDFK